ncbi:MAG: NifU family protein [Candidatus Bipolaricaulota bacterium]
MHEQVRQALETLRPALQADGGDIELVEITEQNVVRVRLSGACHSCPMAAITLHDTVARYLKEQIPQVAEVEAV